MVVGDHGFLLGQEYEQLVLQLLQPEGTRPGQRVPGQKYGGNMILPQNAAADMLRVALTGGQLQAEIRGSLLDRVIDPVPVQPLRLDADMGPLFPDPGQKARDAVGRVNPHKGQLHADAVYGGRRTHPAVDLLLSLKNARTLLHQHLSAPGEHQIPVGAHKQGHPQIPFQIRDVLAQGRLADVQVPGRPGQAQRPSRLIEIAQLIVVHRFSAEDGVPGGMTIDGTVEFCKEIDGLADIIHISNGLKWAGNQTKTFSSFLEPHGLNVEYAARVKAAVKQSKVAVIGGFNSPELCEEVLAAGKADFIELGRQCFADPDFPNKALNGQEDQIRRCVRCFQCYPGFCEHPTDIPLLEKLGPEEAGKIYSPFAMGRCAINPDSGFGWYPETMPEPQGSRKVLIVGGGPGGLQCAITCARRGHKAVLVEKAGCLGGTMNFTDTDGDKVDLRNFKNLLIREAGQCGTDLRVNTEVTRELLDEIKPDVIVIAVGGYPAVPPIPGIDGAMDALSVYQSMDKVGHKVVLVGGGLVGCEVGLHLASSGRDVTVVEMQAMMAPETFGYYRNALLTAMDARGIHQVLGARCLGFEKDGVKLEKDGQESFIPADTCVFSMGMKPHADVVEKLRALAGDIPVKLVGDCLQVGKMGDAVRGGYMAAMEIV